MTFKSLVVFALFASIGRVMAAPIVGARNPCQGIWCARYAIGNGHSDLSRRLADFDGNNVTLSSGTPGKPTAVDPSPTLVDPSSTLLSGDPTSTLSSVDPTSTLLSVDPSSTLLSVDPSSTLLSGDPTFTPPVDPLSTVPADPSPTTSVGDPAAGEPVTVTVISTVFLSNPAPSLPTQSPTPSDVVPSSSAVDPSSTVLGDPLSSVPEGSLSSIPTLVQPSGIFTSFSQPAPAPSPTVIELSDDIPSTPTSPSNGPGQPSPPTPTGGIVFLPPS